MKTRLFTKDFTLVVIGEIISLFGNAVLRFALPLYLLRETGSPALFGIVTACSFLPMIVLSFLGGILADRANKRNIMVFLDFFTGIIVIGLLLSIGTLPTVPLFIVTLMLLYGISGTYQPTVQASIPALVGEENILSTGAIVNQIGALTGLLGPIVGGLLFGAFGITLILIISFICFFVSAGMETFIHIPCEKRSESGSIISIVREEVKDSFYYVNTEKPVLMEIIGLIAAFNLVLTAMLIVGIPVLIVDTLKMSDGLLGFTQGVLAFGGLCGGIATGIFRKKLKLSHSHYLLLFCAISVGVMAIPLLLGMSNLAGYGIITAASFVIMGLATVFSVHMMATVQIETPPQLVGKVIALIMSIAMCMQPIGQAIYGVAFDLFPGHIGIILLIGAVLSILIALASKKSFKKM